MAETAPWESYKSQAKADTPPWEAYSQKKSADSVDAGQPDTRSTVGKVIDYAEQIPGNIYKGVTTAPTVEGTENAMVQALPVAGTMVGQTIGAAGGFPGEMIGGGLGSVAGNIASTAVQDYREGGLAQLLRAPTVKGTLQAVNDDANAFTSGMGQVMGGKIIGEYVDKAANAMKTGYKASKDAIVDAAHRLGFEPTPGMVSSSPVVQGLESSLEQSPTLAGNVIKSNVNSVRSGIQNAAQEVLSDVGDQSAVQTGQNVSKGLVSNFGEQYQNVQGAYQPFNDQMPNMVPTTDDKLGLAKQIAQAGEKNLSLKSNVGSFAKNVSDAVLDSKSLDDIEGVRKQVSNELTSMMQARDWNAVDAISKIQDHLSDFRDNQFMKLAPDENMAAGYKHAQMTYADMMNNMKSAGQALGISVKNPKAFIDTIATMPPEQMSDKLFKTNNFEAMEKLQQYFPDEFEAVKKLKLQEIYNKSLDAYDNIDPHKLVKQYNSFRSKPEVQQLLFGDKASTVQDLKTVMEAAPKMVGPSGTPQGHQFQSIANILQQPVEAARLGIYKTLASPGYGNTMQNIGNFGQLPAGQAILGAPAGMVVNQSPIMSKTIKTRSSLQK